MKIKQTTFPNQLETERLILRPLKQGDETCLMEIYSDKQSSLLDDWVPWDNISSATEMVKEAASDFENKIYLTLGIIVKETNKLIGCCGLFNFDDLNKKCAIFYQANRLYWNNGYTTEAIKSLVQFAFEKVNVNRIEAFITPGNTASEIVLKKNGFIKEGLMREMEFYKGQFWDGIIMAMLKSDYDKMSI